MTSVKSVLILGCGRSGTSIFGELFSHLKGYRYFSEPEYSEFMQLKDLQPFAVKVPREPGDRKVTPGLSIEIDEVLTNYPDLEWFWIVRHPLDTICSLKVGISRNWGHHPRPPDWEDWLAQPLLDQCVHHWKYINQVGFAKVRNRVNVVKFEDLLLNTTEFAQRILDQVYYRADNATDELDAWIRRVQNENNKHFIEAKTSRSYSIDDHQVKVGRWKENMTEEEAGYSWSQVREVALSFGYDKE